jgi:putative membrane protein
MARHETVIARARFDPRLATYFYLHTLFILCITFVFAPFALLWLFVGRGFHQRQYEALSCELTARTLNVKRGVLVRVQQNVPLEKITDLALVEGPLLRRLGLTALRIETAGGGQATSTGQAMLLGVVDSEAFRDQVMAQRDAVVFDGAGSAARAVVEGVAAAPLAAGDALARTSSGSGDAPLRALTDEVRRGNALLEQILDALRRRG